MLIFLNLLMGDANHFSELLQGQAQHNAALADSASHTVVNRASGLPSLQPRHALHPSLRRAINPAVSGVPDPSNDTIVKHDVARILSAMKFAGWIEQERLSRSEVGRCLDISQGQVGDQTILLRGREQK